LGCYRGQKTKLFDTTKGDSHITVFKFKISKGKNGVLKTGSFVLEPLTSKQAFLKVNHDSHRISLKDRAKLFIMKSPFKMGDIDEAYLSDDDWSEDLSHSEDFGLLRRISGGDNYGLIDIAQLDNTEKHEEKNYSMTKTNNLATSSFMNNNSISQSLTNPLRPANNLEVVHENGSHEENGVSSFARQVSGPPKSSSSQYEHAPVDESYEPQYSNKKVNKVREYLLKELR
jgi:hypothetical protein